MATILVAYSENRVIGNKGDIPWRISEDFKHFKRTTVNQSCIMGRKTWDSLPDNFKPLPNRVNIVLSRKDVQLENENKTKDLFFESSLEEAIEFSSAAFPEKEIFIIGGAQIYQEALNKKLANRIIASEVKGVYEGDTFFPELQLEGMEIVKSMKVIEEFEQFRIVEYAL